MRTKAPLTAILSIWSKLHDILLVVEILYYNTRYGRLPGRSERKKQRFYMQDVRRVKTSSKRFLLRSYICVEGQKKLWKVSKNSRIPYGIWNVYRHANLLRA